MWYKLWASHGNNHRKNEVEYQWHEKTLDNEARTEVWDDWAHDLEWPNGGIEAVDTLPSGVRNTLIDRYKRKIQHAQKMLEILNAS